MAQVTIGSDMPAERSRTEPRFPQKVDNIPLAGAAVTVTVPAGVSWVWLKVIGDPVWVRKGGTAAAPVATTMDGANDGSGSWPVTEDDGPQPYHLRGTASFSVFSDAAILSLTWCRELGDL